MLYAVVRWPRRWFTVRRLVWLVCIGICGFVIWGAGPHLGPGVVGGTLALIALLARGFYVARRRRRAPPADYLTQAVESADYLTQAAPRGRMPRGRRNGPQSRPGKVAMLALGIASEGRNVDSLLDTAQIEIIPNRLSVGKGIERIWAPFTPRTTFELATLSASSILTK